jgi:hypothetical protein
VMYDGVSKKSGHSAEWVRIVKEFLNQGFTGCHRVAKCPCTICWNYRFLDQDEVQVKLCQEDLCQTIWCGMTTEMWSRQS